MALYLDLARVFLLVLWFGHCQCSSLPDYCNVPGPVVNLTARGQDNFLYNLEWHPPRNVNASCVSGYQVCLSKLYYGTVVCYDAATTSLQVEDVFQSRQCTYFAAQVSTVATGGETTSITNITLQAAPRAIVDLETKNTTSEETVLKWNLPPIAMCADHYVLTTCVMENVTSEATCTERKRGLGRFIWNSERVQLTPCAFNRLEVAVANSQEARAGEELVVKTGDSDPPAVSGLTVKVESSKIFALKWVRPKNMDPRCTPGYKVCYGLKGSENMTCDLTDEETWDNKHSNKTLACSTYTVGVASVDAVLNLDSLVSKNITVDFHTGPAEVTELTARNMTANSGVLTWQLDEEERACVDHVNVSWRQDVTVRSVALPADVTSFALADLAPCRVVHVTVSAVDLLGARSSLHASVPTTRVGTCSSVR